MLSLLNGPALTSIHDSSKNYGFDYTEFCQQSNVSNLTAVLVCHNFPSKEQLSFNFMASGTICNDSKVQENLSLLPHFPLLYTRKVMGLDALIFIFLKILMLSFKPAFLLSSLTLVKRNLRSSWLSAIRVVFYVYLGAPQGVLMVKNPPAVQET